MIQSLLFRLLAAIPAAASIALAAGLDRARIHADYEAGDFDKVIRSLESFRESGRTSSQADSLFLEKHLAVVYAADPATRERGRYHMLRMLALDPGADILDMFVGEEVDGIFEKVRKESRVQRAAAPALAPRPASWPAPAATGRPAAASAGAATSRSATPPRAARHVVAAPAPSPAPREPAPRLKAWNLEPAPAPARAVGARTIVRRPASVPTVARPSEAPRPQAARLQALSPAVPESFPRKPAILRPIPPSPAPSLAASGATPSAADASEVGNPGPENSQRTEAKPRWREPGVWVGGAAAAAVVGLTLYFSGAQPESKPRSRTFAVPAKASE